MVLKYLQRVYIKKIYKHDVDIYKTKVSDKKLYNKRRDSYKHYVFYEGDDKYIPLKITLLDVPGYYNIFSDDDKTMNFKLDDDS